MAKKNGTLNKLTLDRKENKIQLIIISKQYINITDKNIVSEDRDLIDINLLNKIIYRDGHYINRKLINLLDFSLDLYNIDGNIEELKIKLINCYYKLLDRFKIGHIKNEHIEVIIDYKYIGNDKLYDSYEILD